MESLRGPIPNQIARLISEQAKFSETHADLGASSTASVAKQRPMTYNQIWNIVMFNFGVEDASGHELCWYWLIASTPWHLYR